MKRIFVLITALIFFSCNNEKTSGKFTVTGEIKNAPDQKVFLEELHFNNQPPTVIDTAKLQNGKVELKGIAAEEGMYRIRLESGNGSGFFFINDKDKISFTADANDAEFKSVRFNSPANASLKKFINHLDSMSPIITASVNGLTDLKNAHADDSTIKSYYNNNLSKLRDTYNNFILKYIDTTSSPIVALFAFGYADKVPELRGIVAKLAKRFPNHHQLNNLITVYNQSIIQDSLSHSNANTPAEGLMAPDLTLPDTDGKPFSLSSLKGKYILVDFWASWCGPCRGENPNVVVAYKKFKDKNFTIVGVSLDKDKKAWLKAIKDDGLAWKQISDLKFWNSAAVALYNFDGIPYNVLIDPQGRIIAKELRGDDLQNKLAEVLK